MVTPLLHYSPVCEPSTLIFFLNKMHFYLRKNGSVIYGMSLNLDLSNVVVVEGSTNLAKLPQKIRILSKSDHMTLCLFHCQGCLL